MSPALASTLRARDELESSAVWASSRLAVLSALVATRVLAPAWSSSLAAPGSPAEATLAFTILIRAVTIVWPLSSSVLRAAVALGAWLPYVAVGPAFPAAVVLFYLCINPTVASPSPLAFSAAASAVFALWLANGHVRGDANFLQLVVIVAGALGARALAVRARHDVDCHSAALRLQAATSKRRAREALGARLPTDAKAGRAEAAAAVAERDGSVIFVDVASFGEFVARNAPVELVELLEAHWKRCAAIAGAYSLDVVEVSGGSFLCTTAAGAVGDGHAFIAARFGLDILAAHAASDAAGAFAISVGVASGPFVAGLVGTVRVQLAVVGDVVNAASRMAELAPPGAMRMMSATAGLLAGTLASHGVRTAVKGFGEIDVYEPVDYPTSATCALRNRGRAGEALLAEASARLPALSSILADETHTLDDFAAALAGVLSPTAWCTGFADAALEASWRAHSSSAHELASFASALVLGTSWLLHAGGVAVRLGPWTAIAVVPAFNALHAITHTFIVFMAILIAFGPALFSHAIVSGVPLPLHLLVFLSVGISLRTSAWSHCLTMAFGAASLTATCAVGVWSETELRDALVVLPYVLFTAAACSIAAIADEQAARASFAALEAARTSAALAAVALKAVLPPALLRPLLEGARPSALSRVHADTALLTIDIANFTALCRELSNARAVMSLLNEAFATFEVIADRHGAYKIKSVGDALLFAVGIGGDGDDDGADNSGARVGARDRAQSPSTLLSSRPARTAALLRAAVEIQAAAASVLRHPRTRAPIPLRAGLHVGSVVGGVVAVNSAVFFDVFGVDVAVAKAAEEACPLGAVFATSAAAAALRASELPGLSLVLLKDGFVANVKPDAPVWSWRFDVFREPVDVLDSMQPRELYGAPLPVANVRPMHPSPCAVAGGEARLAAAALALLRGPGGDVLATLGVSDAAAAAFVREVRATMSADHAFHNWLHVVSVLHATALVLATPALEAAVPPLLRFTLCVAALGHDAGHPGTTSAFECKVRSPIALAHGGAGPVLERFHAASTLAALERAGTWAALDAPARARAVATVDAAIMATDMAVHNAVLASLQARAIRCAAGAPVLDGTAADADAFAGEVLHTADLSAAAYGAADMKRWAAALYAEFSALPALERAACVPVTPFFAELVGAPAAQARLQVAFVAGTVRPLWVALDEVTRGALAAQLARIDAALVFHTAEAARLAAS